MNTARRHRRFRITRYVAWLAAVGSAGFAVVGVVFGGLLSQLSAVATAAVAVVLATVVGRLERQRRVEVAASRAAAAAEYSKRQATYTAEHRSFTEHMMRLLDAASGRISVLRRRVDALENELVTFRLGYSTPAQATPTSQLARFNGAGEWDDLWPDLAEAPTVVDLVQWDERVRQSEEPLLDDAPAEHREQRTA